jgi:hypothetical protein
MFNKEKGLLVLTLLIIFTTIIIANAQEVPVADSFRFPLEDDWSPLWQDFNKWNSTWNGYHLGEDVGREDADKKNYAVYPMTDGIVKFANIVLGYTVIIEHGLSDDDPDGNYVCSVYYHMKRPEEGGIKLTVDESVSMDRPIGYVSGKWEDHKSSPHLHFGIRKGHYETGKDPRTGFWYYPGYTVIKKDSEVQKNPNDPIHKQILADWFNPSTDPKNGTGFIERHIAKIEQTTEISKTTPIITSPLKITSVPPYYVEDTINAEFTITNQGKLPINFSVLTVGGRDPDNQVTDFSHRQNIALEPSESYDYKGTLALNKVGNYNFFCVYQTPDGNWNTCIDLDSGLTNEDRAKEVVVIARESEDTHSVSLGYPEKILLVKPRIIGKPAPGYYISQILAKPDEIKIFGNYSKINNLEFLETIPINVSGITKTLSVKVPPALNEGLNIVEGETTLIEVTIQVKEALVQKTLPDEEEITTMEAIEDRIEKEKLLIDSSLYRFEYSKPIPEGPWAILPVSVSGPADELALMLTNPKGETDIEFISKRALIDNFETVSLLWGNVPYLKVLIF